MGSPGSYSTVPRGRITASRCGSRRAKSSGSKRGEKPVGPVVRGDPVATEALRRPSEGMILSRTRAIIWSATGNAFAGTLV